MSNQVDVPGNSRVSSNVQPQLGEQVTSVSTISSGPFLTSRSVSSAGVYSNNWNCALTAPSGDNQSQCHHGKAPPIHEFTGEDSRVTFDDWLREQPLGMGGHKMSC